MAVNTTPPHHECITYWPLYLKFNKTGEIDPVCFKFCALVQHLEKLTVIQSETSR
jgi:hypothetical protein